MSLADVLIPQWGKWYRLRDGSTAQVLGSRDAVMLDGKTLEPIWYGKFNSGGLCAWNFDGTYRASSGQVPHPLDIIGEHHGQR